MIKPARLGLLLTLCAFAALIAGCASDEEYLESADFGNSVRHMIALQTASPEYAGTGLDGVKATAALNAYRQDVPDLKKVEQALTIGVAQ